MPKNVEKMSFYYSPNFNLPKRSSKQIKYLIFHYTGMKTEISALNRLTDINSKVSCHYLIKKNGQIIKILPELYTAWHAGVSFWKKDKSLNSKSIGIEISNPGHEYGYEKFSAKQIKSILKLTKNLINKFKIKKINVLGHSDIAPLRKIDPGEKFPWELLSKNNLSIWHNLNKTECRKLRKVKIKNDKKFFILLKKFGYLSSNKLSDKIKVVKNFQRRFRPKLIDGIIDKECYLILKSLV